MARRHTPGVGNALPQAAAGPPGSKAAENADDVLVVPGVGRRSQAAITR
jgi:hypothetical protein